MAVADEDNEIIFDRYGFILRDNDDNRAEGDTPSAKELATQQRREAKWLRMFANWPTWVSGRKSEKLRDRCAKGIPDSIRGLAWQYLCGAQKHSDREAHPQLFEELSRKQYPESHKLHDFLTIVDKDLYRTFPDHYHFQDDKGAGQMNLRKVLRAYASYNPTLGYCQGMSYVAGVLVMYMLPEDAFWCLVRLLQQVRLECCAFPFYCCLSACISVRCREGRSLMRSAPVSARILRRRPQSHSSGSVHDLPTSTIAVQAKK